MTIASQLDQALVDTPRLPRDAVAVALAHRYAGALDDCFDDLVNGEAAEDGAEHARKVLEIARLGARLEAVLDRLGMSPGSRPALKGDGGERGDTPEQRALAQLQSDAAAGAPTAGLDYTASVDPAVTEADTED